MANGENAESQELPSDDPRFIVLREGIIENLEKENLKLKLKIQHQKNELRNLHRLVRKWKRKLTKSIEEKEILKNHVPDWRRLLGITERGRS